MSGARSKYVVTIGSTAESAADAASPAGPDPTLLGQKGAGLVRMHRLGLPVPPGLVLTTELWRTVSQDPQFATAGWHGLSDALWADLWGEIAPALAQTVDRFCQASPQPRPRLLAVRSGAAVSMPGMLESILNLGLSPTMVEELASWSGNRRFAFDCYRRFLRQYAQGLPAAGTPRSLFRDGLDGLAPFSAAGLPPRPRRGAGSESESEAAALMAECAALRDEIRGRSGAPMPDDPAAQLKAAIEAVLRSAQSPRAQEYRRWQGLERPPGHPDELGTAVVIQAMVFGNRGERSATGVLFTRDPSTGEATPYGEYLPCAQGEDVVGGTAMPRALSELEQRLPTAFARLIAAGRKLESHLGDLQDLEFTIEEGELWLLQTRVGKRSGRAMVRIAVELCREGVLKPAAALARVEPARLHELLHPTIEPATPRTVLARGLPASPGVASGQVAFSCAEVEALVRAGGPAILVRINTSSDDIRGIRLAAGVLTARGGMTSHAAVVARGLGRCAVVGASTLSIDQARQTLSTREHTIRHGETITIDGNSGEVIIGEVARTVAHIQSDSYLAELRRWAAAERRLRVYALVDSELEAQLGQELGADGVILRERSTPRGVLALSSPGEQTSWRGAECVEARALDELAGSGGPEKFVLLSLELDAEPGRLEALEESVRRLRAARPQLLVGLNAALATGSQEPALARRALAWGLDFIVATPLRLPIGEVAAAQAAHALP